jgi:hypothetical protein
MSTSLWQFILDLLRDKDAQEAFESNPHAALAAAGLDDLCGADVAAAAPLVLDSSAVRPSHDGDDGHHQPPSSVPGPGETELDVVIKHIAYITKNYTTNDNDSFDNSVNQSIWNSGELELDQVFDNDPTVAYGDGSVAAGDDVEGTVTTGNHNTVVSGDDNTVGDGNVDGNNNDVANGDGSVAGDGNVGGTFGDGAAVATNGSSADSSTDVDVDVDYEDNDTTTNTNEDNDTTTTEDNDTITKTEVESEDNDTTITEIEVDDSLNENVGLLP